MEFLETFMKKLKKEKVDDAVLTFARNNSRQIKFADNKIVKTGIEELSDLGIFVVKDKKIVTTSFKDVVGEDTGEVTAKLVDEENVNKIIKKIMDFLKAARPKEDYKGINEKNFSYKDVEEMYDEKIKNVNDIDLFEKGMNGALNEGAKRTNGILELHEVKETILTSNDISFSEKKSELYFSIRSFFGKDESGHMNCVSNVVNKFDIEKTGMRSGKVAKDSKGVVNGKKGRYDILFSPLAFAPILNAIGESASIFSVDAGMSFFSDKLNKKVGSGEVNLYDDGRLRNGIGSTKADMEGVVTKKNVLVEEGMYKTFLHNTSTARNHNVESTGNAGLISPNVWNVEFGKGDRKFDDLIKEIKHGLYVTNVWYTRFANYHTGDFSTIPRDGCFLIKDGEITGSWKGIRVSENVLNILSNVKAVENKQIHLRSWEADTPILSPSILVKNCNVTVPTK